MHDRLNNKRRDFIEATQRMDEALLAKAPGVNSYIRRIGARLINFRHWDVEDEDRAPAYGYHRHVKATIRIKDRELTCSNDEFAPTAAELKKIEAELAMVKWPTSIDIAKKIQVDQLKAALGGDPERFCVFMAGNGTDVLFVQERIYPDKDDTTKKMDLPWSFWSDGQWRMMQPDGLLPLYNVPAVVAGYRWLMIHEGATTAQRVIAMLNSDARHPWKEELAGYKHLGWPGGANNPHGVDWKPITRLAHDIEVVISCDNDQIGIKALIQISQILKRPLKAVIFDKNFDKKGFDLADPFPKVKDWWKGERYIGPLLEDFITPATWATGEIKPEKGSKGGRPSYYVLDQFAEEWVCVAEPAVFINRSQPNRLLSEKTFNRVVRPFSHVDDTGRLLARFRSSHIGSLTYAPGKPTGEITVRGGGQEFNTFAPSNIKPLKGGDPTPFLDFLHHLFPLEHDRYEMKRWIATLIVHPEIRMFYSVLLISVTQGVGKGTLGAHILAPLVGIWNTSIPSEQNIIDPKFNSWIAHKRLAVVHEMYTGQSRHTYDRLKSVITDSRLMINRKYIEEYELDICIHVIACSNSLRALHLDDEDRRWFVPRVTENAQPLEYWQKLYAWLQDDGLRIIMQWAIDFLKTEKFVATGERPPTSSAKVEVIYNSRTPGQRLAFDFVDAVKARLAKGEDKGPYVFSVQEIHQWIAAKRREIDYNDRIMESPLTIRNALRSAGLHEPVREEGKPDTRFKVNGYLTYIVSTDPLGIVTGWKKGDERYRKPDDIEF